MKIIVARIEAKPLGNCTKYVDLAAARRIVRPRAKELKCKYLIVDANGSMVEEMLPSGDAWVGIQQNIVKK
ncbi:MAG: hypothetical protein LAT56_00360 [Wenzhouxiangella sp.]|nr:hypothetical protein [Wenzhouxiangella sp.]